MCFKTVKALVFGLALLNSAPSLGLAQEEKSDENEIDQAALQEAIEAASVDASEFAASVAARAEAYSQDAYDLRQSVVDTMAEQPRREVDPTDFTSVAGFAPDLAAAEKQASEPMGVFAFGSFSMPEEALKRLVQDAHAAQIPVVLRGFHGASLGDTARAMHTLIGDTGEETAQPQIMGGVIIDPRAYRVFEITHVPAFVATAHPLPDCDGLTCSAPPPPHDLIAGNITLKGALEILVTEGEEAPLQARAALARLEAY